MKKLFRLLLLVAIISDTYGQSKDQQEKYIEGQVVSSLTGKPLEDVPVLLKNTTIGTVSSKSGYFKILDIPKGTHHRLNANYWGYLEFDSLIDLTTGPVTGLKITLKVDCPYNKSTAETDIKKGEAKLLLVGGIAPVYNPDQHRFEKKYKVQYVDFGCTPPADACIEEYNKRIFTYLDNKYGRKWREEVRQDVEYLTEKK